ncbi:MAG: EI24 domain-containing protein [Alphaproteobacteria bacterium]|nr:EI24 domain-containing protein [Alphaproteobacteria bacterium]
MISALFKAVNDISSPQLRPVLWKSIGLSVALFAALWLGVEVLLSSLAVFPWPWLTTLLQVTTGLGLFAAFFFLMAPVTALFAGLFQDAISARLEAMHYPQDRPGQPLAIVAGMVSAVKFAGLALGVNLVVLPLVLFAGFGAVLMLLANAYLISREYFTLAAARYMPVAEAANLRREHALQVFLAGLIPGALALVPFINFVTPVFATSYFLHYYKQGR